ncbi:glycoside hydrolase family 31 protein [Prolixibacter sp. NT017]|uniref:glycoside hydrolase family 31 protein n=1 Tax=Prolixibacter sp. NT017 TaxID=2652390 RepID=UPI001283164B|nr:TIM-barrel domain-containing protein [Prolixibacter sp. NT017]GET25219.1 alpha-glucosidase [Prolixibacter sp. NT017]
MKKRIIQAVAFLFLLTGIAKASDIVHPGNCRSYSVDGNTAVFSCENNIKVQIKEVGPGVIRIWYDTDDFHRNNQSFAVVADESNGNQKLNISEQPQHYEIYTGDLIIRVRKAPFHISIFDKYQKLLMDDYQNRGFEMDSTQMASYISLRPGERIYGLGEKNGSINRVGHQFKMWNSDNPCYQVDKDPLYKSIPFFMSSEGYGIYFDNTFKTTYHFGTESADNYSFAMPGGEMIYYFIYGPSYKQIIGRYMNLTGHPIMPPDWALGFSQSRGMLTNEKLTREIANGFRKRQIPCDIIFQDIGWTQYLQDFNWRKENYMDPVKMLDDLENQGFKVIVSQDPVVSQANNKQWNEADSLGYFVKDIRTGKSYDMPWPWGGNCGVVDFTNPAVADWWGNYQQKVIDQGVRGFWTDMGEPAWSNEEATDRLNMKHYLGMHAEIHNVFGLTWDKVVTEEFEKHNPNTRIFQMTRSAFAGMQRYTFGWSGDAGNGEDVTKGWKKLAGQIPLALSAGMGGIPFWSCDISGYCGDITDYQAEGELYTRWIQFGVFNPISRAHHEGNNAVEPWRFGPKVEAICKKAIERKYQLFPYIYSYARKAHDTGLPLMRALMLEYPDDPETADLNTEFLFGKELLVAPVTEEGAASKKVYLPEGKWIDFDHPETIYDGKQWIDYPVSLETTPLFVRKGSIVPMMPVMQYIQQEPHYPLILHVYPASVNKRASFSIYEDDGQSNDYKRNIFAERQLVCSTTREAYTINYSLKVENGYHITPRELVYRLYLNEAPHSILTQSGKMKKVKEAWNSSEKHASKRSLWSWDKETRVCTIYIPANQEVEHITIEK